MFAHDVPAANGVKADIAALACAGNTVTAPVGHIGQIDPAPFGGGLTQHQRRARGRIDLVVVVAFDDLDIEILVQRSGDLFGQLHQQVDPKAHVARPHDHRVTRGRLQPGDLLIAHAGGANHMHTTRLRRQRSKFQRRFGRGEVDHGLRLRKCFQRIVGHGHAQRGTAHGRAHVLTDPVVTGAFDHADQSRLIALRHGLDQHLPHTARSPCDDDPRNMGHGVLSLFLSAQSLLPGSRPLGKGGIWA